MNRMLRSFLPLLFMFVVTPAVVHAQAFEGSIAFRKTSASDTVDYVYYVKGDKVRIDEIGAKSKKVEGSYLIDTKAQTMYFLSHDRKTWGKHDSGTPATANPAPTATATKNKKTIQGYNCTEWIVKTDATEISYWVAAGKFNFFMPMLKLINRKEKFSTFYQALNPKAGSFAFLAIQKEGGKETGRLEVTSIEKKTIAVSEFEIPKEYKEFK